MVFMIVSPFSLNYPKTYNCLQGHAIKSSLTNDRVTYPAIVPKETKGQGPNCYFQQFIKAKINYIISHYNYYKKLRSIIFILHLISLSYYLFYKN